MVLRRVAALGFLALLAGCARVREVFEPAQFIAEKRPGVVYLRMRPKDGASLQRNRVVVAIANPRVSGDSVLGTVVGYDSPVAVPFQDVHSVSATRLDGGRTALFALGITAAAALTAYVVLTTGTPNSNWVCDYDPPEGRPGGGPVCGYTQ